MCRHKVDIKKKGKPYAEVIVFLIFDLAVDLLGTIIIIVIAMIIIFYTRLKD